MITKVGIYRLSSKAIKTEALRTNWCNYTGIDSVNDIGIVILSSYSPEFHNFFYFDKRTNKVVGAPEYRKLDSFFIKDDNDVMPKIGETDLLDSSIDMRCDKEELKKFFTI